MDVSPEIRLARVEPDQIPLAVLETTRVKAPQISAAGDLAWAAYDDSAWYLKTHEGSVVSVDYQPAVEAALEGETEPSPSVEVV